MRCARVKERGRDQREDEGYRWLVEFDGFPWQSLRTPARNSASLAAIQREKGEGEGGGGPGPFIGVGRGRITQGVKRNEEGE
jgi:hypothetical protein